MYGRILISTGGNRDGQKELLLLSHEDVLSYSPASPLRPNLGWHTDQCSGVCVPLPHAICDISSSYRSPRALSLSLGKPRRSAGCHR